MTNKAGGILKKIALVFLCIILFILLLLGAITTFVSSDLAKNEVEQLAKNYVNGDVKIGDIDFDFYSSFLYLSLQLDSVDIRSNVVSIPSDSLCFVERLRVRLGFNSLLIGRFSIKEVLLENPKIILRKDSLSQYNFDILTKDTTEQDSSSNTIDLPYVKLKELNLKNASIVYEDLSKKQRVQLDGLNIFGDAFCTDEIGATVDFEIKNITCSDQKYAFNNIPFSAKADIVGEKDFSKFSVKKLDVNLNDVKASVNGEVELDSTEIQTDLAWFFGVEDMMILKEFLPSPLDQKLKKLMLEGSVAVDGTIKGTFAEKQLPAIAANLNLNQLTLYFKGYKGRLSFDLHADGLYDENKNANSYLKLKNADLELIMTKPDKAVLTMADGRHLWRVIDNLMNNICKYSQPGSRVYLNLEEDEIQVRMVFRNVSRYQLNITSEELMERFVRGDKSRNTEGHGLGLSIAKSLMELMDGQLKVLIDGDLFKVIVTVQNHVLHSHN